MKNAKGNEITPAKARRERSWPQVKRVYSSNFADNMDNSGIKCWVPLEDVMKLEKKYLRLFRKYQKVKQNGCNR